MNRSTHPFEQEEVMAYLDGELPPEQAATMAAHLEACADCAALADDLRRVSRQVCVWQLAPAPTRLTEVISLVTATHQQDTYPSGKMGWHELQTAVHGWFLRPWVWVSACLVLALLISVRVFAPHRDQSSVDFAQVRSAPNAIQLAPPPPPLNGVQSARDVAGGGGGGARLSSERTHAPDASEPMIARTVSLTIVAKDFPSARAAVDRIVRERGGYIANLTTTTPTDAAQTLTATLRIPAPQLDAALTALKGIGRIEKEDQSGEDVSKQHTDLVARLKNARASEQRLVEILRQRPGKVSEVLEVEQEIARVREEIETMDSDRKDLEKRIQFATVALHLVEEYKAQLDVTPPSTGTRLRNALVGGYRDAVESLLAFLLFLLSAGPSLLVWAVLLFFPARMAWRHFRRIAHKEISLGA